MKVFFLKSEQINLVKWNQAISESVVPLTYAYSWYLDAICDDWGALVTEDFSIVMPLPYRTKFNQLLIYMPSMISRLGFFSKKIPNKSEIEIFFNALPKNILSFDILFNKYNTFNRDELITKKMYYSIDLNNSYSKTYNEYSSFIKDLKYEQKTYIISGLSINEIIAFLNKIKYFYNAQNYNYLRRVLSITLSKKLSSVYAVFSETNELIGVGVFVLSSYSADLLIIAAIDDDIRILSLIIDKFIKINSGKVLTLNFECHFSANAVKFYSEFGASKYYRLSVAMKRFPKIFNFFSRKNK